MDQKIKRGIDLENRFGGNLIGQRLNNAFAWWKGGKLNKNSFFFIGMLFIINLLVVFPLFTRDLSLSYSSTFLLVVANFLEKLGISRQFFFSFLTIFSLSLSPIAYYLFVRRIVLRHELTAFLATIIFIMPNPFFKEGFSLARALIGGDGSHAFAFSFIPLLLLYTQAFVQNGLPAWGVLSSIVTALIAIISPFAMFNLLILFGIIALAEGFLGNLRIKMARILFLLACALGLSFFWYYPNFIGQASLLSHVEFTIKKLWSVFPIVVPLIPIFGVLSFLLFDKREKLKPIFIGSSLFFIYIFLFLVSKNFNITGIFTAERYLIEMSFAFSFLCAIFLILLGEFLFRKYIFNKSDHILLIALAGGSFIISFLALMTFLNIQEAHAAFQSSMVFNSTMGIGNLKKEFNIQDLSFIFAGIISLLTFIFLIFILRRFPLWANVSSIIKEEGK